MDVRYFQLDALDIPNDLEDKFLRGLVLKEETEAEQYKQDASVVRKETDAEVRGCCGYFTFIWLLLPGQ